MIKQTPYGKRIQTKINCEYTKEYKYDYNKQYDLMKYEEYPKLQ